MTDISPSTDISDVPDIAWFDTEVVSDYTEEYTIVLRMEEYGNGMNFDELWRVLGNVE